MRFVVSGAETAGEGEIKIVQDIHEKLADGTIQEGDSVLLVGSDADLVLLGAYSLCVCACHMDGACLYLILTPRVT